LRILALAVLLAATVACSSSASDGAVATRATSLALTGAAVLTSTAAARPPTATATAPPSATPRPTASPTATTPPPTATSRPSPSPTPCVNDSDFVTDINVPDGTHFAPGASFTKTWRLRNDGSCTWTTDYTFRYVAGDAMSGTRISLPNAVPPGATIDLSVSLTAPAGAGSFRGTWQMFSPASEPFGSKPYVDIRVP
jgi:hypothetical protein